MKRIIKILILLFSNSHIYSQQCILGYYECWPEDMYGIGHTRLYLHLDSDSKYTLGYWDDTQREKTYGKWFKENDTLFFHPSIIDPKLLLTINMI